MADREDWRSQRRAEVTVGPAMVLVDAALLHMAQFDRLFRRLDEMPAQNREDRARCLAAIISVGREIGLPAGELEALRVFEGQLMDGVLPSTARGELRPPHRQRGNGATIWPDR